jgi:glycogen(starch) synthase
MHILMLTWDFPPTTTVGLTRQAAPLSAALVAAGHSVTVVTRHVAGAPSEELTVDGVRVLRAGADVPSGGEPLAWIMAVNHELARAATAGDARYDLIHAFGWLVTHAAIALGEHLQRPLVATMHATEAGRNRGYLPEAANRSVHAIEWQLGAESVRVLVPSDYVGWEVGRLFDLPAERIAVVPLGVDAARWKAPSRDVAAARLRFAGEGPLVVYAGRLAREKGIKDLLAAAVQLRVRHPGTRVVVAGDGPQRGFLIEEASRLKLHRAVTFPGRLDRDTLAALLGAADAVVLPSRYQPNAAVALEAAAAGAPLAVSSTGALRSVVEPGVTGLRFPAGDVDAIVEATSTLIGDPLLGQTLGTRARQHIEERHAWPVVAARTIEVYRSAIAQAPAFAAQRAEAQAPGGRRVVVVPPGNLLAGEPAYRSAPFELGAATERAFTGGGFTDDEAIADAAWTAGVAAARAAVRAEAGRAEAAREEAEREMAGRVASDALDIVLASTQRA